MIRTAFTIAITLLMPRRVKPYLLNLLGHQISSKATINISIIFVDRLYMADGARIMSFNVIRCRRLVMRCNAYIDKFNRISGPLSINLAETAAIGRSNVIYRAPYPTSIGPAVLRLGRLSKITSSHLVDCMSSISIGDYSTVAGAATQLWTHGYKHESNGPGRFRIDGKIIIGDNVYIGSASVVIGGVKIVSGVSVGSHSSVSKSLLIPGLYVSQPLRLCEQVNDAPSPHLKYIGTDLSGEVVYQRDI